MLGVQKENYIETIKSRSKIYPEITFKQNIERQFVTEVTQIKMKPLTRNDSRIATYTYFVKKILNQIEIQQQYLWICQSESKCQICVYFSQPLQYPVANCCSLPIFIRFDNKKNGNIACTNCKKIIYKFIHSQKPYCQENSQQFNLGQNKIEKTKNQVRKTLTSLGFRVKNLQQKIMIGQNDQENKRTKGKIQKGKQIKGSFIIEVNIPNYQFSIQKEQKKVILSDQLLELKLIIQDIFI